MGVLFSFDIYISCIYPTPEDMVIVFDMLCLIYILKIQQRKEVFNSRKYEGFHNNKYNKERSLVENIKDFTIKKYSKEKKSFLVITDNERIALN